MEVPYGRSTTYEQSQQLILEANKSFRQDKESAQKKYIEAANLQFEDIKKQPENWLITKAVFGLSACSLFWKGGDWDKAKEAGQFVLENYKLHQDDYYKTHVEEILTKIENGEEYK